MTFTIPAWLLWTLAIVVGVPALIATLVLAWFGWVALNAFSKGGIWR